MNLQEPKPVLGISACLLGQAVRFNGGHKHAPVCTQLLGELFDWRPVCPETESGLGVPRPPVRLVATDAGVQVRSSRDPARDFTAALAGHAQAFVDDADRFAGLSGFVLMQKSPSCGLFRVPLYNERGHGSGHATGVFAAALRAANPWLPCEEAGRLHDPLIREHFVTRVMAWHDWQQWLASSPAPADLLRFYRRYKYRLMAHSPLGQKSLGRLLSDLGSRDFGPLQQDFAAAFFAILERPPTRKGHANALQHIRGYLEGLYPREQQRLDTVLEQYRHGHIPRSVPLTLLRHQFDRQPQAYIDEQVYLNPQPGHPALLYGA